MEYWAVTHDFLKARVKWVNAEVKFTAIKTVKLSCSLVLGKCYGNNLAITTLSYPIPKLHRWQKLANVLPFTETGDPK